MSGPTISRQFVGNKYHVEEHLEGKVEHWAIASSPDCDKSSRGIWINPIGCIIVMYCEGDMDICDCGSVTEFELYLEHVLRFEAKFYTPVQEIMCVHEDVYNKLMNTELFKDIDLTIFLRSSSNQPDFQFIPNNKQYK